MQLFTKPQFEKLLHNGQPENQDNDHHPVVKLFIPGTGCTWLLTQINPENHNLAFGLCDLGLGFPELGYVCLEEIASIRSKLGYTVERDRLFKGWYPITVYARAASRHQAIVEDEMSLRQTVK